MKTITRPGLTRAARFYNRLVAAFAVAVLSLTAACTTSHPVFHSGSGSARTIVVVPEAKEAASWERQVEAAHGARKKMQCWRCDGVSWIRYNADTYTDHTCPFCSTVNTL